MKTALWVLALLAASSVRGEEKQGADRGRATARNLAPPLHGPCWA